MHTLTPPKRSPLHTEASRREGDRHAGLTSLNVSARGTLGYSGEMEKASRITQGHALRFPQICYQTSGGTQRERDLAKKGSRKNNNKRSSIKIVNQITDQIAK